MPGLIISRQFHNKYEARSQQYQYMAMDDSHLWPEWHGPQQQDKTNLTADARLNAAVKKLIAFFERKRKRAGDSDSDDDSGDDDGSSFKITRKGVKLAEMPSREMLMGCRAWGVLELDGRWWGNVEEEENQCICIGCKRDRCPFQGGDNEEGGVADADGRRGRKMQWDKETIRVVEEEVEEDHGSAEDGIDKAERSGGNWYSVRNGDFAPSIETRAKSTRLLQSSPPMESVPEEPQEEEESEASHNITTVPTPAPTAPFLRPKPIRPIKRTPSLSSIPEESDADSLTCEPSTSPPPPPSPPIKSFRLSCNTPPSLYSIPEEDETSSSSEGAADIPTIVVTRAPGPDTHSLSSGRSQRVVYDGDFLWPKNIPRRAVATPRSKASDLCGSRIDELLPAAPQPAADDSTQERMKALGQRIVYLEGLVALGKKLDEQKK